VSSVSDPGLEVKPFVASPVPPPTDQVTGASADDLGAGALPPAPVAEVTSDHVAFFRSLSPPDGAIAWADGHPTVEETKAYLQSLSEEDRNQFLQASDAWQELKAS
jgi:hypothetical protein